MTRPRWRKILRDLWDHKVRTLLVMLNISVGVFAVGFVGGLFFITLVDMDADYQSANPHGAIIFTDLFDKDLLPSLQRVPGVGLVEGRSNQSARIHMPDGEKRSITFTAVPALEKIQIDKIRPLQSGASLALGKHEVFIEGSAQAALPINPGDPIKVELFDGKIRELRFAGFVHEVTSFPYAFTQQVTAYVTPETIKWLGGTEEFSQLYLTVTEKKTDEAHVREVAQAVADKIEDSGRQVLFVFVFQPGRHFATDITKSLGALMGFMGGLTVALSAFLVFSTINALIAQQIRQIGMMKAVGAGTFQLVGMYIVLVLSFGILALVVAVPLSELTSGVGGFIATYLNFLPGPYRLKPQILAMQAFVALVVPVLAAVIPVFNGARITVREAISSYGLGHGTFGKGLIDRILARIHFLSRPLLISLRNTFRRKARLALTLSTLTLAGAIFIAVFNLRASMNLAINEIFGYLLSDINLSFTQYQRLQKVLPVVMNTPDVVDAEAWGSASGSVLTEDSSTSTEITLLAPPAQSTLIDPTLTSGRWLLPEDENAIVIGNHLIAVRPELKVGDEVTIDIDGETNTWKIVGIYRMAGNVIPPILYTNREYFSRLTNTSSRIVDLRITTTQHDAVNQRRIARELEANLDRAGIDVGGVAIGAELIALNTQQTDILVYFLLVMAVLIAFVGGLGMMSTMSLNVFERTREIGVMRAIGASDGAILQLVIVEGMLIGVISWVFGALLAVPLGQGLAYIVGITMLQSPLNFVFSLDGFFVWLMIVLVISALASALPARNASRLTVREVLAYE
jgi:putative ABC transport system permease protein